MPDVKSYEPLVALEAGEDGLAVFSRLVPDAARALGPGGSLIVEVGHEQAGRVVGLAERAGFASISVHQDLSGKERIVEATLAGAPLLEMSSLGEGSLTALGSALRAGAVVGLPTDTVYGLAAAWDSREGVKRLCAAKGRGGEQPVAVLFASVEALGKMLTDLDPGVRPRPRGSPAGAVHIRGRDRGASASHGRHSGLARSQGARPCAASADAGRRGYPLGGDQRQLSGRPAPATLADVDPGASRPLLRCALFKGTSSMSERSPRPSSTCAPLLVAVGRSCSERALWRPPRCSGASSEVARAGRDGRGRGQS